MKKIIILIGICLLCPIMISTPFRSFMNMSIGSSREENITRKAEMINVDEELTKLDLKTEQNEAEVISLEELIEDLIISEVGSYHLNGNVTDKKIIVDLEDDENIHLILESVNIKADNGPAICINNAGKVIITVIGENTLKDDAGYEGEAKACIYSTVDLTINGNGILYVYGYNRDGIRSKDRIKIVGSQIYVQAKNDGIRGNDGVLLKDSIIDIQSEGTGIKTISDKDYVAIQGGQCKITAGENAIVSESQIGVKECVLNMYSVKENIVCNGVVDIEE